MQVISVLRPSSFVAAREPARVREESKVMFDGAAGLTHGLCAHHQILYEARIKSSFSRWRTSRILFKPQTTQEIKKKDGVRNEMGVGVVGGQVETVIPSN